MAIFPTSADARLISENNLVIFDEARAIERAVLVAAAAGLLTATVDDDTTMTNSTPADATSQSYFNIWQKTVIDRAKLNQMNAIITYFESRGYSITRESNANDATVLQWTIEW